MVIVDCNIFKGRRRGSDAATASPPFPPRVGSWHATRPRRSSRECLACSHANTQSRSKRRAMTATQHTPPTKPTQHWQRTLSGFPRFLQQCLPDWCPARRCSGSSLSHSGMKSTSGSPTYGSRPSRGSTADGKTPCHLSTYTCNTSSGNTHTATTTQPHNYATTQLRTHRCPSPNALDADPRPASRCRDMPCSRRPPTPGTRAPASRSQWAAADAVSRGEKRVDTIQQQQQKQQATSHQQLALVRAWNDDEAAVLAVDGLHSGPVVTVS